MERFVYNAAIACAVIAAVIIGFGGRIHIEMGDAFGLDPVQQAAVGRSAVQTYHADSLQVDHAAARIVITPEDRSDVSVEIDNPGGVPMPTASVRNNQVYIDGHLRGRIATCLADGARIRGYGDIASAQLPLITVHLPRAVKVDLGGATVTQIGASQSIDADLSGCGETTIADTQGDLKVDFSGSGQMTAGAARHLGADISGSGEIQVGAIADGADLDVSGSGSTRIASLTGPLKSDISGSGGVVIGAGQVSTAEIDISGSSETHIAAPVDSLNVDVSGSGAVSVDGGPMSEAKLSVGGSGQVHLAGPVQHLSADLAGSGGVEVAGDVHDLDAQIAGSGTIRAHAVTGALNKEIMGSGNVIVGR
ncbi:MAG: DUF2807 domain-containing protein [Terricaulis silvestris]